MPAIQANIMRTYGYYTSNGRYSAAYANAMTNAFRKATMANQGGEIKILPVTKFARQTYRLSG